MLSKIIIFVLLFAMLASLGTGLFHLIKSPNERDKGDRVVKALTWRIGIWVFLFGFLMLSMKMGWIKPSNSVNPQQLQKEHIERKAAE